MSTFMSCFGDENLRLSILDYLDCFDLLQAELVSKSWQLTTQYIFSAMKQSKDYKYLTFKRSNIYNTDKKACYRIASQRKNGGKMLLLAGSFGSVHNSTCTVFDKEGEPFYGEIKPSLNPPIQIGSAATVYDTDGKFIMIGGWNDSAQEILDTVYSFNPINNISKRKKSISYWNKEINMTMLQPRCFAAAERNIYGDIIVIAGGDSPYRGGQAYSNCSLWRQGQQAWQEDGSIPSIQTARCGHSAVTTFDDRIVITGGYAGGTEYLNTVEMLTSTMDRWISLPSMSVPRSGAVAVLGPGGEIYVAGGSPDGTIGHKSLERYDLREGKWTTLTSMHRGRGYTAGCLNVFNGFYISGGMDNLLFQPGVETYDFRTGRWEIQEISAPSRAHINALQEEILHLQEQFEEIYTSSSSDSSSNSDGSSNTSSSSSWKQHRKENMLNLTQKLRSKKVQLSEAHTAAEHLLTDAHFKRACHQLMRIL